MQARTESSAIKKLVSATVLLVSGGLGSAVMNRPDTVESTAENRISLLEAQAADSDRRLASIDATVTEMKAGLDRLELLVKRLIERK